MATLFTRHPKLPRSYIFFLSLTDMASSVMLYSSILQTKPRLHVSKIAVRCNIYGPFK